MLNVVEVLYMLRGPHGHAREHVLSHFPSLGPAFSVCWKPIISFQEIVTGGNDWSFESLAGAF